MNMFALTDLQKTLSERLSEMLGEQVFVGRYVDITDSFHIYGSYFSEFENFIKTIKTRDFKQKTWDSSFAQPFFEEARKQIAEEQKADKEYKRLERKL